MLTASTAFLTPLLLGLAAAALIVGLAVYGSRRVLGRARQQAARLLDESRQDLDNQKRELLVAVEEKTLALEEEADQRERDLEARETALDARTRELERESGALQDRQDELGRRAAKIERAAREADEQRAAARADRDAARETLERVAGMTADQARAQILSSVEEEARREGALLARRIEDEARERAEREALHLVVQATQRLNLRGAVESTVSFIELPSDEMKGRIIGREGRNIRALEMATGIDLIVDDTPHAILISSFDPLRREVARVAIERLVEDGRIHPARIEEVVERVREEIDTLIEEEGNQAAFGLGISGLHARLARLVGRLKFGTSRGQNLLRHCVEVALLAGHMAEQVGARVDVTHRAGLLHEIGRVDETVSGHSVLASAELAAKYGEPAPVVDAIRSLHPDHDSRSLESILLKTANRMSDNRPGAHKDNLEIFIERLRRLETLAVKFDGVKRAYAVKAGKEIRVIVDTETVPDNAVHKLSKEIARAIEKQLSYPGQIKVSVVRETRAVRFAV